MEQFDLDLAAFVDEWVLADLAQSTVEGYVVCLRKYRNCILSARTDTLLLPGHWAQAKALPSKS